MYAEKVVTISACHLVDVGAKIYFSMDITIIIMEEKHTLHSKCEQPIIYAWWDISHWWHDDVIKWKKNALLALCTGNSPVAGEFPAQMPVTRSFAVFFDLRLNKRLCKHSRLMIWDAIAPTMTSQ